MAKKLDPRLLEILTTYGERPEDALWDCHGTWVAYHTAIERIAAKADIVFEMPVIVEANGPAKSVAICVKGKMGDNEDYREEWSFGEASAANCKNSYFYAMAEKRAKDRVVLKLIGLHGLAYSEEESDDFKPQRPGETLDRAQPAPAKRTEAFPLRPGWEYQQGDPQSKSSAQLKREGGFDEFNGELYECADLVTLKKFEAEWSGKARRDGWPTQWKHAACDRIETHERAVLQSMSPDALASIPLDKALTQSLAQHPIRAG